MIELLRRPVSEVPLRARWFTCATVGYLVFAIYGSLVPFQFQALSFEEALERWQQIPYFHLGIDGRADFVANILLFVPLAFLFMGALCVDRKRTVDLWASLLVVPLCGALSVAIEFVQLSFPPRTVSINDMIAETAGAIIGTGCWLVMGRRATEWARRFWTGWRSRGLTAQLWPAYIVVLLVIHLMPFDLTISPVEVYHKYREGKIVLIPFTADYGNVHQFVQKTFWNVCYFLPASMLLAYSRGPAGALVAFGWRRALAVGLLLSSAVEFLQLFVYTRHCDVSDILTASVAIMGGWAIIERQRRAGVPAGWFHGVCFSSWLLLALYFAWQPFDFDFALQRLPAVSWVPFADYYSGTEYNAFDQLVQKILLFGSFGALLAWSLKRSSSPGIVAVAFLLATVLEAGQLFLPGRYAGVTDILVQTFGAWLGCAAMRCFPIAAVTKTGPSLLPKRGVRLPAMTFASIHSQSKTGK